MANSDTDIRAQLLELRKAFMADLPVRLALINGHWQSLGDKEWDWNTVAELHRAVHSLVGSSGVFGLAELSAKSREVENACKGWAEGGTVPGSVERARFQEGIDALRDTVVAALECCDEQPLSILPGPEVA